MEMNGLICVLNERVEWVAILRFTNNSIKRHGWQRNDWCTNWRTNQLKKEWQKMCKKECNFKWPKKCASVLLIVECDSGENWKCWALASQLQVAENMQ